ncbi:MAG: hypothetical protein QXG00_01935 [Candidatus Woesearchaeota archaeon]
MKAYSCNICGCEVKMKWPGTCPICKKKHEDYTEIEEKDPTDDDLKYTKLYEEAIKILDRYSEGCTPEDPKFAFEE